MKELLANAARFCALGRLHFVAEYTKFPGKCE
jgi:hypothetical protein